MQRLVQWRKNKPTKLNLVLRAWEITSPATRSSIPWSAITARTVRSAIICTQPYIAPLWFAHMKWTLTAGIVRASHTARSPLYTTSPTGRRTTAPVRLSTNSAIAGDANRCPTTSPSTSPSPWPTCFNKEHFDTKPEKHSRYFYHFWPKSASLSFKRYTQAGPSKRPFHESPQPALIPQFVKGSGYLFYVVAENCDPWPRISSWKQITRKHIHFLALLDLLSYIQSSIYAAKNNNQKIINGHDLTTSK